MGVVIDNLDSYFDSLNFSPQKHDSDESWKTDSVVCSKRPRSPIRTSPADLYDPLDNVYTSFQRVGDTFNIKFFLSVNEPTLFYEMSTPFRSALADLDYSFNQMSLDATGYVVNEDGDSVVSISSLYNSGEECGRVLVVGDCGLKKLPLYDLDFRAAVERLTSVANCYIDVCYDQWSPNFSKRIHQDIVL